MAFYVITTNKWNTNMRQVTVHACKVHAMPTNVPRIFSYPKVFKNAHKKDPPKKV